MKKIVIIIGFLFVLPMAGQKPATLYLKNGTELEGYAIITAKYKIKFRKELNSTNKTYTSKEVDSIRIKVNKWPSYEINTYHLKKFGKKARDILLKPVVYGKVILYLKKSIDKHSGIYNNRYYYVSKENEEIITYLGRRGPVKLFDKNFKEAAIDYFKDCTGLVNKIKNNAYKKRDVEIIVKYYNENCE